MDAVAERFERGELGRESRWSLWGGGGKGKEHRRNSGGVKKTTARGSWECHGLRGWSVKGDSATGESKGFTRDRDVLEAFAKCRAALMSAANSIEHLSIGANHVGEQNASISD